MVLAMMTNREITLCAKFTLALSIIAFASPYAVRTRTTPIPDPCPPPGYTGRIFYYLHTVVDFVPSWLNPDIVSVILFAFLTLLVIIQVALQASRRSSVVASLLVHSLVTIAWHQSCFILLKPWGGWQMTPVLTTPIAGIIATVLLWKLWTTGDDKFSQTAQRTTLEANDKGAQA